MAVWGSGKLESQAREVGAIYLSCPVFGPPPVAKAAQLILVVSGAEEGRNHIRPLLVPAIGKSIIDVGEDVGKGPHETIRSYSQWDHVFQLTFDVGASLKLLGNTCILGTVELLAETYALADSIDFDPHVFQDFIRESRITCSVSGEECKLTPKFSHPRRTSLPHTSMEELRQQDKHWYLRAWSRIQDRRWS